MNIENTADLKRHYDRLELEIVKGQDLEPIEKMIELLKSLSIDRSVERPVLYCFRRPILTFKTSDEADAADLRWQAKIENLEIQLSQNPNKLTSEESRLIIENLELYLSLDSGVQRPKTEEQKRFVAVCRGSASAKTSPEIAYQKYKELRKQREERETAIRKGPEITRERTPEKIEQDNKLEDFRRKRKERRINCEKLFSRMTKAPLKNVSFRKQELAHGATAKVLKRAERKRTIAQDVKVKALFHIKAAPMLSTNMEVNQRHSNHISTKTTKEGTENGHDLVRKVGGCN